MPTIPAVRFVHTEYVSILRPDAPQVEMQVYHTNGNCPTYRHYLNQFQKFDYEFREGIKECIFCQKLNEEGK